MFFDFDSNGLSSKNLERLLDDRRPKNEISFLFQEKTGCCTYIVLFFRSLKKHLRQHNGRWQIRSLRQRHLMGEMNGVDSRVGVGNSKVGVGYFTGKWPGKHRNSCSNCSICLTGGSPEKSLSPSFTNQILCMDFVVKICVCFSKELVLAISFAQGPKELFSKMVFDFEGPFFQPGLYEVKPWGTRIFGETWASTQQNSIFYALNGWTKGSVLVGFGGIIDQQGSNSWPMGIGYIYIICI